MHWSHSTKTGSARGRKLFHRVKTLVLLTFMVGGLAAYPQPAKAAVAEPYLQYLRIWKVNDKIYAKYCGVANQHRLLWGEIYPGNWSEEASYGAMKGCWTAYLFYDVRGNERLWLTISMDGTEIGGVYHIKFDAATVYYPEDIDDGTNLYCDSVGSSPWLRNDLQRPFDADAGCTFVAFY